MERREGRRGAAPRLLWGQSAVYSAFVSLGFLAPSHVFLSSVSSLCSCPVSLSLCVSITLFLHFSLLFLFPSLCLSAGHPNPAADSSIAAINHPHPAQHRFWGDGGRTYTVLRSPHLMASGLGTLSPPLPNPPPSQGCPVLPMPALSTRLVLNACVPAPSQTHPPALASWLPRMPAHSRSQQLWARPGGGRNRGQSQGAARGLPEPGCGESPGGECPIVGGEVSFSRSSGLGFCG